NEGSNLVTGFDVWNLNPTNSSSNSVQNLWFRAYYTINSANVFLEGMAAQGTQVVGQALADNYIAEAKLVRALCYMQLLQFYAKPFAAGATNLGVPLRLTGIKEAGHSDLARSTVDEVYKQIIKDLNEAEGGLPLTYASATDRVTRAHKNAAIALKTRMYLAMQKYPEVITEANKMVSSAAPFEATSGVNNKLNPSIAAVFSTYTTLESVLSMPMSTTSGDFPGTQNQLAYYYTPTPAQGGVGNGEYSLNPAGIIGNTGWVSTDARRALTKVSPNGKSWLMKCTGPSPYTDWVPVIRYSEVMLNLAEALARTSAVVDVRALNLLNAVRQRSDATTTFVFATKEELIQAILTERRIELLGEGFRNFDLMRLLQTIPAKGIAPSKKPTDDGYIWPISAVELNLNKLAVDN
ncbi:MAG: RagB/SusD family nutrient uptake outer membrane protein, partial [Ginsengibacter sp.]